VGFGAGFEDSGSVYALWDMRVIREVVFKLVYVNVSHGRLSKHATASFLSLG
jgi:hypothetical protein